MRYHSSHSVSVAAEESLSATITGLYGGRPSRGKPVDARTPGREMYARRSLRRFGVPARRAHIPGIRRKVTRSLLSRHPPPVVVGGKPDLHSQLRALPPRVRAARGTAAEPGPACSGCERRALTAAAWLSALQASGQVALLQPWFSHPTQSLVKTPKIHLCDTGLCSFLMGVRSVSDQEDAVALLRVARELAPGSFRSGAIICRCPNPYPLAAGVQALPLGAIPETWA